MNDWKKKYPKPPETLLVVDTFTWYKKKSLIKKILMRILGTPAIFKDGFDAGWYSAHQHMELMTETADKNKKKECYVEH